MSGLRSWNFWTPIYGTLYSYRAYHPDDYLLYLQGSQITPRTIYAYGGKTTRRDWEARVEEHLWGGGAYDSKPDPWADTVLGWHPDGTVEQVMAAGGYRNTWQGRTVPLLLSIGEILIAIKLRRPLYNHQWNLGNRRRIPIYMQEDQRQLRDLARGPGSPVPVRGRPRAKSRNQSSWTHSLILASPTARSLSNIPRWLSYYRRWLTLVVLAGLVGMFWPGMPGATAVTTVLDWVTAHRDDMIAIAVIAGALVLVPFFKGSSQRRAWRRPARRGRSRTHRRR